MASKSARRVRFSHDSDSLMNPLPTVRVVFNIHLSPADLMVDSEVEFVKAPMRRPMRRLFGSLADLCASLDEVLRHAHAMDVRDTTGKSTTGQRRKIRKNQTNPITSVRVARKRGMTNQRRLRKSTEKLVECENCGALPRRKISRVRTVVTSVD